MLFRKCTSSRLTRVSLSRCMRSVLLYSVVSACRPPISCRSAAAAFSAFSTAYWWASLAASSRALAASGSCPPPPKKSPMSENQPSVFSADSFPDALLDGTLERAVAVLGLVARDRKLDAQRLHEVALLPKVLAQLAQREVVADAPVREVVQRGAETVVQQVAVDDPVVGDDPRLGNLVRRRHGLGDQDDRLHPVELFRDPIAALQLVEKTRHRELLVRVDDAPGLVVLRRRALLGVDLEAALLLVILHRLEHRLAEVLAAARGLLLRLDAERRGRLALGDADVVAALGAQTEVGLALGVRHDFGLDSRGRSLFAGHRAVVLEGLLAHVLQV